MRNPQSGNADRFGNFILRLPSDAQCLPRIRDLNDSWILGIIGNRGNSLFSLVREAFAELIQSTNGFLSVSAELNTTA